jgi:very-short-patch-repair endonuclease
MDRYRWAERRDGLITNDVASRTGLSKHQREAERTAGRLRQVRRGVSVVNGAPPSWRQAVRAVLLSCGDHVAASHLTAITLLGGDGSDSDLIHVIADLVHQVRMEGVIAHRSGLLEDGDIVTRDGMRCTSPLRTVIDLSGTMTVSKLGKVVDDLLRRKVLRLDELRARVDRTRPAPGRSVATLRKVLAKRLPGYDPGESELEGRISRLIDARMLPRPMQQHRVRYGGNRYRIDFAWPDRKLYLEGNGFGWHMLATDLDNDARRQNELVLDGWAPIEITWRMTDAEIADTIRRFLALPSRRL